jgi:hypothetical protein
MALGLCDTGRDRVPFQPGRGFAEAAAVLGAGFAGVLMRDGWAPYQQFTDAAHQTCLAI